MILDLVGALRPPHPLDFTDADPAVRSQRYESAVRGWQWRINNTVLAVVSFCLLVAWASSPAGLPMLGNLAWAGDTEQKIRIAVTPLQTKVNQIAQQTQQIKERQDSRELSDLRQKLFETRVAQCKARARGKEEGNPYTVRMGELQDQHFKLVNTYYLAADCGDL